MTTPRLPLPALILRPFGYPSVAQLPVKRQLGLRAFWLDGLFASLADGFTIPYYVLYLLSLNASTTEIGFATTLTQLAGALMAIPGAAIADRTGRYRYTSTITGIVMRAMWLVMLAAPWLFTGSGRVWLVTAAWVVSSAAGSMGAAAWMALQADLIPPRLRGAYLSSRNIIMQLVRMGSIVLAGWLVTRIGEPAGYQVSFACAYGIGLISLYYYVQVPEHDHNTETQSHLSWPEVIRRALKLRPFMTFLIPSAALHFAVMFVGPFVNVYLKEEIGLSPGEIGLVTTFNTLATLIGMRIFGQLADRRGNLWVMRFGLIMPLAPWMWLIANNALTCYVMAALMGLAWSSWNLGAFNLLLALTPGDHRPRYMALHTTSIALAGSVGPAVGGILLEAIGYWPVFSFSVFVRYAAMFVIFALLREPSPAADVDDTSVA